MPMLKPNQRSNYRKPKRILIVDDSQHIQHGIAKTRHLVEKRGHTIHTATNYDEAVRKIREHKPDIVLTDFQLSRSGPTGLHVAREARQANPRAAVRVHTMAAQDLRKAESILKKFDLRKEMFILKKNLVGYYGCLKEKEFILLPMF